MRLTDDERRDWLRLYWSENIGPTSFRMLLGRYGDATTAIEALPELSRRGGMTRSIRVCAIDDAERWLARADALGARFIAAGEDGYPPLLRHVESAPPLLCVKGSTELTQAPALAVVGARNASAAGRRFTRPIVGDIVAAGYVIVSGLARGIDTAAHEASLETGTIAVIAGGIDVVYPPENEELFRAIAARGLVVTEMLPGTVPQARHFPRRNRLIAGLSRGVLVVEAAQRSGSLITARLALEQNREVFAVPGSPLDPRSEGTNGLIRDGATLVTRARDVISVLEPLLGREPAPPDGLHEGETTPAAEPADVPDDARALVLELLGPVPVGIDDIVRESGLDVATVLTITLELELAGRVTRYGQHRISLA